MSQSQWKWRPKKAPAVGVVPKAKGATVLQQEFQELQALWGCRNAENGQGKMRAKLTLTSRWQQWSIDHTKF